MEIIEDFQFKIDKEIVFKSIDCYKDSNVYEEACRLYDKLSLEMHHIIEPKGVIKLTQKKEYYNIAELKNLEYIFYCILTLGNKVSEKIDYFFKNDNYMEGLLLSTMADVLLFEYSNQLSKKVCIEAKGKGLGLTMKLSPGNDLPIQMQKSILDEFNSLEGLNLKVTEGFMLNPVKSLSFIFGADSKLDIKDYSHECSKCIDTKCKMRKEPYIEKNIISSFDMKVIKGDKEINIKAIKSKTIMENLIINKIDIHSPCAGNGTCGKCRVKIIQGKVKKLKNNDMLGEKLLKEGWCLACSTYIEDNSIISIDDDYKFKVLDSFDKIDEEVNSSYRIQSIDIDINTLNGRSIAELINKENKKEYEYTLRALKGMGAIINSKESTSEEVSLYQDKKVDLIIYNNTIIDVYKFNESRVYAIAIDIGTTTIALCIIDLISGQNIKSYTMLNSQKQFGADVISRIHYSSQGNLNILNEYIIKDLIKAIRELCKSCSIKEREIYNISIAGNTTMIYFLLCLSCESLARFPFNTITTSKLEFDFYEIFKNNLLNCRVTLLPSVSAYVGADIVAGMLQCEFYKRDKICILIDIGTNGEMVIGNKDKMLCLSTAAGPAFEGSNIKCGIGSVNGAINSVNIKNNEVLYNTIGDEKPIGICGSAVIDITASCLLNSIIDKTGRFDVDSLKKDYINIAIGKNGEDIIFTQKDIREVQLAKAAICTGIEILLKEFNASYEDIDTVFLAGGFGYYMNVENAATIGLIPKELKNKVKCVGNSSLGGTIKYLLNRDNGKNIDYMLDRIKYIDISLNSEFNDLFIKNMMFN